MIKLVHDTISKQELYDLSEWLKTEPKLTKGQKTLEFEDKWSKTLGCKYSVFVNSGSSANLLMIYALLQQKRLAKEDIVLVPAVSWATTVAPIIQFGLHPMLVDADKDSLGVDVDHLEKLCKLYNPRALMLVHALGFPCKMKEIVDICHRYNVILLEDTCESLGSMYHGKNVGTFGLMSSFSLYFGHHLSTIEGGMICTDDERLYEMLKMLRSHGWDRDLSADSQKFWRTAHNVDDFHSLYTFYVPGFNVRGTDLQAFLGLSQLKKLQFVGRSRFIIYDRYNKSIKNSYWKVNDKYADIFVSCFAYPIIHPNIENIVEDLIAVQVEVRPLIAGSMSKQPFFTKIYGNKSSDVPFAEKIHKYGMYVPCHPFMTNEEVDKIVGIVNKYTV